METVETKKQVKKSNNKVTTTGMRISKETRKDLARLLELANKKQFGKRVKASHIIVLALKLIGENHIKELQQASLSNSDKIEMQYREYVHQNGAISKDDFLGKLHELMLGKMSPPQS